MKIAVVGGGSTYTPELIDGFARLSRVLGLAELTLIDPAEDRLNLVGPLGQRMFAREQHPGAVTWTTSLEAGLADADIVLIQLRVGGQTARLSDETFPLECGCVGQETTGAGGLAKALRTVPKVLEIAEAVRRFAKPNAWIVDFTNPVGIVTRALLDAGHRAVGLCNVAIGFQRTFAKALKVEPSRLTIDHVGLNHLTWERSVLLDGVEMLPELLANHAAELEEHTHQSIGQLRRLGSIPSYYLQFFYRHDQVVREAATTQPRAAFVAQVERELLELYADPKLNTKPEQLASRGGAFYSEAAVDLITSLHTNRGDRQVVNMRNGSTFAQLSPDAVVEIPARITADGPIAEPLAVLAPLEAGLISHVSAYEQLAVEAALHGGRDRVFRALLAHPLVGQYEQADTLTDAILRENKAHLAWA
ncbi:6-phospho-beta-glucosidase [Lysinibacter cavernae]|uniref:6-phospho-beta-glucosidase n=1 Tax=Lysinibacter cavernae TaxID=1640652 RepID=A0A7X5QYK2_9MICO|nr:6-phospho-beta-glucosidase [Lysinibacter cavernae]NIH52368.1 6-phospho-beta-glucosidase [Lysinibacter cavernae]